MAIEVLKKIMETEQAAQHLKEKTEQTIQKWSADTQTQLKAEHEEVQAELKQLQLDLRKQNQAKELEYDAAVQKETQHEIKRLEQAQAEKSAEAVAQILLEVQQRYGNH